MMRIFYRIVTALFRSVGSVFRSRTDLAIENLALRQQLAVLKDWRGTGDSVAVRRPLAEGGEQSLLRPHRLRHGARFRRIHLLALNGPRFQLDRIRGQTARYESDDAGQNGHGPVQQRGSGSGRSPGILCRLPVQQGPGDSGVQDHQCCPAYRREWGNMNISRKVLPFDGPGESGRTRTGFLGPFILPGPHFAAVHLLRGLIHNDLRCFLELARST